MAKDRPIDAVAAGHICLDIIPRFPAGTPPVLGEIFTPGKLSAIEEATVATGGPVSNTGIALGILSARWTGRPPDAVVRLGTLVGVAMPAFFLGLILGEITIGSLWTIVGIVFGISTYDFWPGRYGG